MWFIVYDNTRNGYITDIFFSQANANAKANTETFLTAFPRGINNSEVDVGMYINTTTGAITSTVPAAERDKLEEEDHRAQVRDAFLAYLAGRPVWIPQSGTDNDKAGLEAADKWVIMACALIDNIVAGNYLSGQTRNTRNDFIEHIIKNIREVRAPYNRLRAEKTIRDAWSGANIAGGQAIYSDMITSSLGQPQNPDGSYTIISPRINIPQKFDPSQEGLRRP